MDTTNLIDNVVRAVRFDAAFYREAASEERYSQQALTVVLIVAALSGLGSFLGNVVGGNILFAFLGLILGILLAVAGYYVWVYTVYYVGANFFQGRATAPQLLRSLGYAYAPMALGVLSFITCVGGLVALVGSVWALACGFFAVREVHQLDDGKALITVIVGWLAVAIVTAVVGLVAAIFGIGAMGMGALFGG